MRAVATTLPTVQLDTARWRVTVMTDDATQQPFEVHLTPEADSREHDFAPNCWCKPKEDQGLEGPNEVPLWMHNSADRRENVAPLVRAPTVAYWRGETK